MSKPVTGRTPCQPEKISVQIGLPLLSGLRAVKTAFFELCVHAGQQVLHAMMEQDRTEVCGPRWARMSDRRGLRGGSARSEVTLGGRRVAVKRLRVSSDEGEIPLPSFNWAAERDPLNDHTMAAILGGLSTRAYAGTLDRLPPETEERATSRSAVSRRFVALSQKRLTECLARPLAELDLWVVMIDGITFHDHTVHVALGIDSAGRKHVLGLREGTTENATVARALLAGLADRGLATERPLLFVIDGSKALRKAVRDVFGREVQIQRCQVHKTRNVLEHLPEEMRPSVRRTMNQAYAMTNPDKAQRQLENLARKLAESHPGAADSLQEGLAETLTIQKLGISGALWRTLRSTNPIENLNSSIVKITRNVRRWRSGAMIIRWVGTAVLHAEEAFRRIRGYREMPILIQALMRSAKTTTDSAEEVA